MKAACSDGFPRRRRDVEKRGGAAPENPLAERSGARRVEAGTAPSFGLALKRYEAVDLRERPRKRAWKAVER